MSAINPISFKEPYRPNGAQICPVPIDVCIDGYLAIFTLGSRAPPLAWRFPFSSALIDDCTNPEREL
jgi:hypothetical protein